ncbi:MAG: flagellar biosynthesis protein FlhB [Pyrinomonadaceae bacterium]|nr:flagellar biosynthesis protein FlhB [Pyrinomonadaceae bacterium]
MSQERKEKATPKKREDARKKGQLARGTELPTALIFLGALVALTILGDHIFFELGGYVRGLGNKIIIGQTLTERGAHLIIIEAVKTLALVAVPVILIGVTGGVAGNVVQTGFTFTPAALKPKPEKFNPVANIKRVFGLDAIVNLSKSSIKLALFAAVAYGVLAPMVENAPTLINAPVGTVATKLGETLFHLALRYGIVMFALAIADYGYAVYKHEKSLRMTKQEVRDEFKQQEGDPLIKGQRRRSARALVQKRSLAEVPDATVVVTNPTHFAVALRYDRDMDAAPQVVAKGADIIAKKIRDIAMENEIPLVENPPLARALYRMVEPNQMVPVEFFGAVAEILAYVYRKDVEQVETVGEV